MRTTMKALLANIPITGGRAAASNDDEDMNDVITRNIGRPAAEVVFSFDGAEKHIRNLNNRVVDRSIEVGKRKRALDETVAQLDNIVKGARMHLEEAERELNEANAILAQHQDAFLTEALKRALIRKPRNEVQRMLEASLAEDAARRTEVEQ